MSITFLSNPIHLPEFFKFDREYLGKQESQNEDQKVFHKDTLEVSQLSKNRCKETLRMSKKEKSEKNRKKLRNPENMGFSTFLFLKIDILGVAKK